MSFAAIIRMLAVGSRGRRSRGRIIAGGLDDHVTLVPLLLLLLMVLVLLEVVLLLGRGQMAIRNMTTDTC